MKKKKSLLILIVQTEIHKKLWYGKTVEYILKISTGN